MIPKLTIFARLRSSFVSSERSLPSTSDAVAAWMSSPPANASRSFGSPGDVREDAQLDLGVVGGERAGCPDSATNALLISRPSSVRIGIAWRFGFVVESRPVAATSWLKCVCRRPSSGEIRLGSGSEVGVQELRVLAPFLDHLDDRVLVADRAEHARVGRVAGLALAPGREPEHLEQDAGHLLRRAEHELLAGQLVRARLELLDAVGQPRGDLAHAVGVDADADVLHRRQHLGERQLDVAVERVEAALGDPLSHRGVEPERGGGVADERRGLLVRRRSGDELDPVLGREVVERVRRPAGLDQVGHQERVVGGRRAAERCRGVVDRRGRVAERTASSGLQAPTTTSVDATANRPPSTARPTSLVEARQLTLTPGDLHALDCDGRGRDRLVDLVDALEEVAKLVAAEDLPQRRAVGRREDERSGSTSSGRSRRIVASSLAARAWSACSRIAFARAGESSSTCSSTAVERAVLGDQLAGGLVTDARERPECCPRCPP